MKKGMANGVAGRADDAKPPSSSRLFAALARGVALRALSFEQTQPRSPATAAAVEAEQCGCGWQRCGDEKRPPCGIQSLLAYPQRFLLGMSGRRARRQQAENRSEGEIDAEQNERRRNSLDAQAQSLPSGDFRECQNGKPENEGGRTERRTAALPGCHGAQPQYLRVESKLEKINASHDAAPSGRRQSRSGRQPTG